MTPLINKAKFQYWAYASWFNLVVNYRKTVLGPLWLIAQPAVFVAMLGLLYATISDTPLDVFMPHIALGIVVWSLLSQLLISGTSVIIHNKPKILHSGTTLNDLVIVNLSISLLRFMHVILVAIVVWLIYRWDMSTYALVSFIGVALVMINGYWYSIVFGIIGSRFDDLTQIVTALTGALFFVTPIIWMPASNGRGGILGPYLTFNPLHHFMEIIRAPILGTPIDPLSWAVVLSSTAIGLLLAWVFHRKFAKKITSWI